MSEDTNLATPTTNRRKITGKLLTGLTAFLVLASIFQLYTGGFGLFSTMTQRSIHLMFMLTPVFFFWAASPKSAKRLAWYDVLFGILTLISSLYLFLTWSQSAMRVSDPSSLDLFFGAVMILAVLEGVRRTTSNALMLTALVLLLYTYFGKYLPGSLAHRGYSVSRIIDFYYSTAEGIYGIPIGVSATLIILFVIFGSVLNATGGGKFFIDITYALTGKWRGGTGKTAVVASALMGMISGSPIANVVTTGTFTIPLMKKGGFRPPMAAAICALASAGGILMPPVMGAAAFIMAQYLGISYGQVVLYAIIPSLLFYASVFIVVDLESAKHGLVGLSKEELPSVRESLKTGWHLILPIVALVAFLVMDWSASKAVYWSIIFLIVISFLYPHTRLTLKKFLKALEEGARESIPIAVACAGAGIIVGSLSLTGLGVKFSSSVIALSAGSPIIALILVMIACLILGMGMPATAVYILAASLLATPLIELGITPLASHFFIFYFSVISCVTPPVALTAYASAGIANTDPNKAGWLSFYYGILAYIIPFLFVYNPVLLGKGNFIEITVAVVTALIGIVGIGVGLQGYFISKTKLIERFAFFIAGFIALIPSTMTDILGTILMVLLIINHYVRNKKAKENSVGLAN